MTDTEDTQSTAYVGAVLGAGPVGRTSPTAPAAGLSTAVVESGLVGGECSHRARMPGKALLRPVIARVEARRPACATS